MNLHGSAITGSSVHSASPRGVVRLSSGKDSLQHYGVPGQKWGVITKEYEPVAIDKRKLKKPTPSVNQYNKSFRSYPSGNQKMVSRERNWIAERREKRRKVLNTAGYIGAAAVLIGVTYGAYRISKVARAKAYSGILTRFLERNPGANLNTESGRQLLQKGIKYAKSGSRRYYIAKDTNKYLNSIGAGIGKKQALHVFSARKLIDKASKIGSGSNKFMSSVNRFRRQRLARRIMDKLYF